MRCLTAITGLALLSAPAGAELRDVVLSQDGGTAWVQLVFDETLATAEFSAAPGGVSLSIGGAATPLSAITPVANPVVSAVRVEPHESGLHALLTVSPNWSVNRVYVDGHRVVVRFQEAADIARPAAGDAGASDLAVAGAEPETVLPVVDPASVPASGDPATGAAPAGETADPSMAGDGAPVDLTPGDAASPARARQSVACQQAEERITDDPWDMDAMIVQAECLRSDGDAQQATDLLQRVTAMDPERFSALLMLAEIEAEAGRRGEARALFEMAAQAARTDGEAAAAMARARALSD